VQEILERGQRRERADFLPDVRLVAERLQGREARLFRRESGIALLFGFEIEMRLQFTIKVVIHLTPSRARA
jgi:hypothetical protein